MTISLAFLAPALVKAAIEGRLPRGIGVERLRDPPTGNLRRSDSIRNRLQPRPKVPNYGGPKVGITGAVRCNFVLKARLPGTEFLDAETERQNRHSNARTSAETKIQEVSGRKSPQKCPIRSRIGNVRFAKTGWWCAQSDTNWSPTVIP